MTERKRANTESLSPRRSSHLCARAPAEECHGKLYQGDSNFAARASDLAPEANKDTHSRCQHQETDLLSLHAGTHINLQIVQAAMKSCILTCQSDNQAYESATFRDDRKLTRRIATQNTLNENETKHTDSTGITESHAERSKDTERKSPEKAGTQRCRCTKTPARVFAAHSLFQCGIFGRPNCNPA